MTDMKQPELPEPTRSVLYYVSEVGSTHGKPAADYYTADQMHAHYAKGREDERTQLCCGDYESCKRACTPRGHFLAEKEMAEAVGALRKQSLAQPAQAAVPEGFDRQDMLDVMQALRTEYPQHLNQGNITGIGDYLLETAPAFAARLIEKLLNAAPEREGGV